MPSLNAQAPAFRPQDTSVRAGSFVSMADLIPDHVFSPSFESSKVLVARPPTRKGIWVAVKLYEPGLRGLKAVHHEVAILKRLRNGSNAATSSFPQRLGIVNDLMAPAILYRLYDRTLALYQARFPNRRLPLQLVHNLSKQLLSAVAWMHSQRIIHRNLHPQHIMIHGSHRPVVKIIDFSSAVLLPHAEQPFHSGVVQYRPPDLHLGNIGYGGDVDMWSVGCIIVEMIIGQPMFTLIPGVDLVDTVISTLGLQGHRQFSLKNFPWSKSDAFFAESDIDWHKILGMAYSLERAAFLTDFFHFDPDTRTTAESALSRVSALLENEVSEQLTLEPNH